MGTPNIDISEISPEQRNDPEFLSLRHGMQMALADDRWLTAICIHEAAHLCYFLKAGCSDPMFRGPRILFDTEKQVFNGYQASIEFRGKDDAVIGRLTIGEWVSTYALACAAGGAAAKQLTGAPDSGDEEDREILIKFCEVLAKAHPRKTDDRHR